VAQFVERDTSLFAHCVTGLGGVSAKTWGRIEGSSVPLLRLFVSRLVHTKDFVEGTLTSTVQTPPKNLLFILRMRWNWMYGWVMKPKDMITDEFTKPEV